MSQSFRLSRRKFMGTVGVASVGTTLAGCSLGRTPPVPAPYPTPPPLPGDLELRLLRRTTFGPTASEFGLINELGYDGFIEHQLQPDSIDDSDAEARIAGLSTLNASIPILAAAEEEDVQRELIQARVIRAIHSKRQLFERMVEFWTDHFNMNQSREYVSVLKTIDDRDVIRRHALGNFRELLHATAKSPAMLMYLHNAVNEAGVPNEDYARELMELHTLSVDGGYTQVDVEELARALTGWTIGWDEEAANFGEFAFESSIHDFGAKQIMGLAIPAGKGIEDGEAALDYLALHESTARFIATKLVKHFVAESAPASVVDRVMTAFRDSDGDIKTTLRALFAKESIGLAEAKFKRPLHLMVDAARSTGAEMTMEIDMGEWLHRLGHLPFRWPAPNGYPDVPSYWAPGLLDRWNYAMVFAAGYVETVPLNAIALAESAGVQTPEDLIDLWDERLFAGTLPSDERATLLDHATTYYNDAPELMAIETLALALASPSFQWS